MTAPTTTASPGEGPPLPSPGDPSPSRTVVGGTEPAGAADAEHVSAPVGRPGPELHRPNRGGWFSRAMFTVAGLDRDITDGTDRTPALPKAERISLATEGFGIIIATTWAFLAALGAGLWVATGREVGGAFLVAVIVGAVVFGLDRTAVKDQPTVTIRLFRVLLAATVAVGIAEVASLWILRGEVQQKLAEQQAGGITAAVADVNAAADATIAEINAEIAALDGADPQVASARQAVADAQDLVDTATVARDTALADVRAEQGGAFTGTAGDGPEVARLQLIADERQAELDVALSGLTRAQAALDAAVAAADTTATADAARRAELETRRTAVETQRTADLATAEQVGSIGGVNRLAAAVSALHALMEEDGSIRTTVWFLRVLALFLDLSVFVLVLIRPSSLYHARVAARHGLEMEENRVIAAALMAPPLTQPEPQAAPPATFEQIQEAAELVAPTPITEVSAALAGLSFDEAFVFPYGPESYMPPARPKPQRAVVNSIPEGLAEWAAHRTAKEWHADIPAKDPPPTAAPAVELTGVHAVFSATEAPSPAALRPSGVRGIIGSGDGWELVVGHPDTTRPRAVHPQERLEAAQRDGRPKVEPAPDPEPLGPPAIPGDATEEDALAEIAARHEAWGSHDGLGDLDPAAFRGSTTGRQVMADPSLVARAQTSPTGPQQVVDRGTMKPTEDGDAPERDAA